MRLTPQQKMRNYREKLRDNPERYEKIKLKDRMRQKKTRLTWSKEKKKLENIKNCERIRKYRLTLSFAKELKDEANDSFVQNKTPEEILHLLKKEKGVLDQTSEAFSSTPVRNPLLPTDVKTPHTLRKIKGTFNSASKAITSTPARTPKYICSIKKKKNVNSTPARISVSASKAIKYTPARTPLSVSKGINSISLRTPLTASKAIKSTPVRTPLSSSKKNTLGKKNKQTPLLVSENKSKKRNLEEKIEQYFVKHTWLCRRNKRLKIKPRVLMIPMKKLHEAFCDENPDLSVSIKKFNSLKPPKLQVVKKVDFNAFLSIYGGSSKFIISEILKVCVDLPDQFRNLLCLNICNQNKKACKSGACKKCPFHEKISSTDEMEDKIPLRDGKSTMSGTQSKMNIIEKFVIGAFTPPPDLKPLQFHEVSRVLQTRLQENKKNIHIVKIVQGANKSPKLQIQVEKKIKKTSEASKESQTQETEVSKIENKEKNIVSKTVIETKSNNDAVKGSKKGKTESENSSSLKNASKKCTSLRDEKAEKQLGKSRTSIENENVDIVSSSRKKGTNNAKKEEGKTKINKNVQSPKKRNPRAKITDKDCLQIQASTDEEAKKGRKKLNIENQNNSKDESNKYIEDGLNKSIAKENEVTKITKKAIRSRSRTNEKTETILKIKQKENLKVDASKLQVSGNRISKNEGNNICDSSENSKGYKNDKNSKNQIDNENIDVDSASEVSSTPDQSFHEYDESFTLGRKKGKSKPKPRIPLNPLVHKHIERRQSKITTFLSAENSQNNKSVKTISNKPEAEKHLQYLVKCTIDKVLEKYKRDEKDFAENKSVESSEQKQDVNGSEKNVDKNRLKKLKKVRRSIVSALNESTLDELETDVIDEVNREKEVSDRKRKSLISSPNYNNEEISKAPINKKRKTETQILESDKVQKETKQSNSKKKPNIKDQTELPKNNKKITAEAKTAKSGNKNTKNNAKPKNVAVENTKKSNAEDHINDQEKNKSDRSNVAASEDLLVDSNIEKNSKEKDLENIDKSKKILDNEKLKKMKKIRRSIVVQLNESALSDMDIDMVEEVDKKNKVDDKKRQHTKTKPNKKDISEVPIDKKEAKQKNVTKSKQLNSKKKPNIKEHTETPKKNQKKSIEAKTEKSSTEEHVNDQEKNKSDQKNVAVSEDLLVDSNIEKNSKEKDPENNGTSKKIMDNEKLKKMKKVRRSIVVQLNESALSDMDIDLVEEIDKENKVDGKKKKPTKTKPGKKDMSELPTEKNKETKTIQLDDKKPKKNAKAKDHPKTKKVAKPKETKSTKKPVIEEITKSTEINNRAAAEAKARELLMPEDCPITANRGTMKYLEQRSTLLKAIDNQRESDGDIFSSNIFKRRSGVSNLLDSDNIDDTFTIRTPNCKGTIENPDGTSPFTPRTGMFANWADLANVSTHKTPTTGKALPTPTVDTEHKKVVMQVTYHMQKQKNKRRGIRKLQTSDESDGKVGPKSRKNNKSLLDLPNMPEDEIDDLGDDYFF